MAEAKDTDPTNGNIEIEVRPTSSNNYQQYDFADDIDCRQWLAEINLSQYAETFLVNLSADGRVVRRKRLNQLRQQDFSHMNITNYSHQKRLMEHVRLVQKFPFHSPQRKRNVKIDALDEKAVEKEPPKSPGESLETKSNPSTKNTSKSKKPDSNANGPNLKEKKKQARRRRSFDADVWNSISTMRRKAANTAAAADLLREGFFSGDKKGGSAADHDKDSNAARKERRRSHDRKIETLEKHRRWSFQGHDGESHNTNVTASLERARATMYGNMALEYDMMLTQLRALQTEVLNEFKETVNCEVASLFFANNQTRELLIYTQECRWFRVPFGAGICGYCQETGENINIPDAYADYRFNKNMDLKTGFKTRNILCQPVRGMRGGGNIVAVMQALNKIGADHFDHNDEELMSTYAARIADLLTIRFNELLKVAEKFSGQAMFVGTKGGSPDTNTPNYQQSTSSSKNKEGGGAEAK
mmetsp:Transcript_24506/g.40856  ORF Transcript_24506/g.40856 Transcript_24506/m.40856 type:complete len:472 (+) Transcript_24506:62-1477(+)|eukprot:CAMPEP_0175005718 /NCGR_PEP_ID=MMETSP0005-20121125/5461_1 /TAXON_ID=420556 /ORGANISM="Ochromonas sp., Strain CCMP1393" /LENGTH=471 /DNA_ID=CAMNT_0016260979 /DNA_START=1 /DNA_END=1416 /DNA_ORIENTATION=-